MSINTVQSSIIVPAQLQWQTDESGHTVPTSEMFGDVYFSMQDGLAESRYVFIDNNHLPQRLLAHLSESEPAQLPKQQAYQSLQPVQTQPCCFTIAELGFGTGLNFFATWALWQQLKQQQTHHNRRLLHFISFEKHPLTKADLSQALASWSEQEPELTPLIQQFLAQYPPLVAGCHRLNFMQDGIILDLWLGDAADNLAKLYCNQTDVQQTQPQLTKGTMPKVDAWFLDGFAPSCNASLWTDTVFAQIKRLSKPRTTVSSFSCAGVVKRGLVNAGFEIAKVKGFGRKREMLTAVMPTAHISVITSSSTKTAEQSRMDSTGSDDKSATVDVVVVGAGVSGLMAAWSLANRGYQVTLVDKSQPLAGASGNPRGLLAPKMTPLHHVHEHLHSIGYLYACRQFQTMQLPHLPNILESTTAMDLLLNANVNTEQIAAYPNTFAQVLSQTEAETVSGLTQHDFSQNQYLPLSGLINPQALAMHVLEHPNICYQQLHVSHITEQPQYIRVTGQNMMDQSSTLEQSAAQQTQPTHIDAQHLIWCTAHETHQLDNRVFDFRKIRGQLSWFTPTAFEQAHMPKIPLKYGGYCASFTSAASQEQTDIHTHPNAQMDCPNAKQFLLGASFVRNEVDLTLRDSEHVSNRHKLIQALPELATVINNDTKNWHGRVGIRAQTPDYHPLVGQLMGSQTVWTLSGMGSKGFAYAPICAEILADLLSGQIPAVSSTLIDKLSPNRQRLQTPLSG